MTRSIAALLMLVFAVAASNPAQAANCDAPHKVGYRVIDLQGGRKIAVWYPTAAAEERFAYSPAGKGLLGSVAPNAPPAACPRVPLVLFSHGLGGCAVQSTFLTEELARFGYVVAAPDHQDAATCAIDAGGLRLGNLRTDRSLLDPARWDAQSEVGRLNDLRAVIERIKADPQLARVTDTGRTGAIGHSLGGYAVLGLAGGWPAWRTPEVKAVVAMSPFVTPFLVHETLSKLAVPVMYQGGQFDIGITPNMEGPKGAFAASPAPKYYVRLRGGTHVEWTNLACLGQPTAAACLQAKPNVALITRYTAEFLDRHLKQIPSPLLASEGRGLDAYRVELK